MQGSGRWDKRPSVFDAHHGQDRALELIKEESFVQFSQPGDDKQ